MPGRAVFIKASLGAGLFLAAGLLFSASDAASAQGFPGFEAQVHGDVYGQPKIIEDFDGDGKKDIIFGATDGKVHLFSSTGREIFRPPYWPKQTGGPILAEVQLADLDNDGGSDIVVASKDCKVYCLNALGREKWVLDTRGKILVSAPEIADVSVWQLLKNLCQPDIQCTTSAR